MKNGSIRFFLSVFFLAAGIAAGLSCLGTPKVYSGPDSTRFSAVSAANWIRTIAEKPHSVFDTDSHRAVLNYLVSELKKLGLKVETQDFLLRSETDQLTITNIHARLEGKSDDAVLLVSHYDSAPEWNPDDWSPMPGISYGAADAGYGIATLLETLRAVKAQNKPLENDIRVLITDGEEIGCLGAGKEMTANLADYQDVRLVINLEARGIKGPAIMFETGVNNKAVMDYYVRHAASPFSYSFATDIYHLMPNATDFTSFVRNGFTGYNLAVLDNLDYYHTAEDNYANISFGSLQQYGDQVHPIVSAFAFTPAGQLQSFKSNMGSNFFNLLPGLLIEYPQGISFIITGLAAILLIFTVTAGKRRLGLRISGMFGVLGRIFASLAAAAITGTLTVYIASLVNRRQFFITYLPMIPLAWLVLAFALILGAFIFVLLIRKLARKSSTGLELLTGGILFNVLLSAAACAVLPGGTFLFAVPGFLASIYAVSAVLTRRTSVLTPALALVAAVVPNLFIPLIYMFYLALTLGSAGIMSAFTVISLTTVIPVLYHYLGNRASA